MGGIILYKVDPSLNTKGIRWRPAYLYMKEVAAVKAEKRSTDEGKCHGTLCRMLLGCQPSDIADKGGAAGGFFYEEGGDKLEIVSRSINMKGPYSDGNKDMTKGEESIVRACIEVWKQGH